MTTPIQAASDEVKLLPCPNCHGHYTVHRKVAGEWRCWCDRVNTVPAETEAEAQAREIADDAAWLGMDNQINWHGRVVFDVDAMSRNAQKRSAELKTQIDARMEEARQRAQKFFHSERM